MLTRADPIAGIFMSSFLPREISPGHDSPNLDNWEIKKAEHNGKDDGKNYGNNYGSCQVQKPYQKEQTNHPLVVLIGLVVFLFCKYPLKNCLTDCLK